MKVSTIQLAQIMFSKFRHLRRSISIVGTTIALNKYRTDLSPHHRWVGIDHSSPKSVRSFSWLDRRRGEAKTEGRKNEAKKSVRGIQELYKRVNEIEVKNKERVCRGGQRMAQERDSGGLRVFGRLVNRVKNRDDERKRKEVVVFCCHY